MLTYNTWAVLPALLIGDILCSATTVFAQPRARISLNGAWQSVTTRDPATVAPPQGWMDTAVPGTLHGPALGGSSFTWYRRDITVPQDWRGRRVFLHLSGARYHPHVFLDGRLVAERLEGWTPFEVELQGLEPGRAFRLEVRCQDWGATFKAGYTLPEQIESELRSAPQGQVLAPIGGHFSFYGLWDEVWLEARPAVYLEDVALVTSVRDGTLTVTGALSGGTDGVPLTIRGEVIEGAETALALPATQVQSGRWRLAAAFPNAHLWSPEDPHLYLLRLELRDGDRVADVVQERFGFRELWAEGPDFYLNGVKRHLLASSTWPTATAQTREEVRRALETIKAAHIVAFRLHTQPWQHMWLEEADEVGMMIVEEGALWCDAGGAYAYLDERFWQNTREHLAGMVRRDRNHASLVMWSLENELLHCGAARYDPDVERKLADLGRFVKQLDPAHLITYEADLDPGGVADVIGLHYPHELPDVSDYPNTADWLAATVRTGTEGGPLGSWAAAFRWSREKPLYIGEYLWVPYRDYSPGTVFFGDRAYTDREGFNLKAKAEAWRHQTLAYRRAGVSALCPWTAFGGGGLVNPRESLLYQVHQEVYEPVAAFLHEQDTRFLAGEIVTRTFDVFNDSPQRLELELSWVLEGGGAEGRESLTLDPAAYQPVQVQVPLPVLEQPRDLTLRWTLASQGQAVHRGSALVQVNPQRPLATRAAGRLVVFDPGQTWSRRVREEGLAFAALTRLREAATLDSSHILLIAPGALEAGRSAAERAAVGGETSGSEALLEFLNRGGRALVLEQESFDGLPLNLSLVDRPSTLTFPTGGNHPALAGLDVSDLRFWRGDHYVSRREIVRPAAGGGRALLVSGGRYSLDQGPLLEMPVGAGTALLCQALVGEKLFSEPVARRLFQQALDYLADRRPQPGQTLVVTEEADFAARLRRLRVAFRAAEGPLRPADLEGVRLVILHGGGGKLVDSAPALREYLQGGGDATVYWHAPEPEAFGRLREALGTGDMQVSLGTGPVVVRRPEHPILTGLCREDLAFAGAARGESWMRGYHLDPAVIDRVFTPEGAPGEVERVEVEEMALEGPIVVRTEDGNGILFASYGSASFEHTVEQPGLYPVTLLAGGTPAAGVYPLVNIEVDGNVAAQINLTGRDVRTYTALVELLAGRARITLSFANDAMIGGEDRNLILDAVLVGREPAAAGDAEPLTLPPALVLLQRGGSRVMLDGVRWDRNPGNELKGARYASVLLANLGAQFVTPQPGPAWVEARHFRLVGDSPHFEHAGGELRFRAGGMAAAPLDCVRAGRYLVFVRGHSDPAQGGYGIAQVSVDGQVVGEVEVASQSTETFALPAAVDLTEGEHTVSVTFTNDLWAPPEDRNLYINAVGFRPAG